MLWDCILLGKGTACVGSALARGSGNGQTLQLLTLGGVIQSIKSTIFLEFTGLWISPWKILFKTMGVFAVCKINPSASSLRFPTNHRTLSALQQKWENPGMPGTVQGSLLTCATSTPLKYEYTFQSAKKANGLNKK